MFKQETPTFIKIYLPLSPPTILEAQLKYNNKWRYLLPGNENYNIDDCDSVHLFSFNASYAVINVRLGNSFFVDLIICSDAKQLVPVIFNRKILIERIPHRVCTDCIRPLIIPGLLNEQHLHNTSKHHIRLVLVKPMQHWKQNKAYEKFPKKVRLSGEIRLYSLYSTVQMIDYQKLTVPRNIYNHKRNDMIKEMLLDEIGIDQVVEECMQFFNT